MPDYRTLNELARNDETVLNLLTSEAGHVEVSESINNHLALFSDFRTSEASVRRWRVLYNTDLENPPDDESELAEDIGSGMGLDDAETVVDESWQGFTPDDRANLHSRLDATLGAVNADPKNVAGLRVGQYQMVTKDNDGQAQVHDLYSVKLLIKTRDLLPAWPVVQPATPSVVNPVQSSGRKSGRDKIAVVLPDPQIGYRFFIDTQEFDPFHDEQAMDVALQITQELDPDLVLCLGDYLDFPAFGTYEQEQAFAATTQHAIDRGHKFAAQLRASAPDAKIVVMEGNHDRRLQKMITRNALAAFGLRCATDTTGWPVLSLPYLCGFDALNISYIEGYPAGEYWINDNLRAIHGLKVRSNQSTAAAVVKDDDVSTLFGHIHRMELEHLTRSNRKGGRSLVAVSPGCLCRVDGSVPSVKGSTDLNGRPIESYENWQHGVAVVEYREDDSPFSISLVHINTFDGYETHLFGKTYFPSRSDG